MPVPLVIIILAASAAARLPAPTAGSQDDSRPPRWELGPYVGVSRDSLRVGYKFHHLSNAFTAPLNPGIDAAVFLVGFERAIGSR